MISILYDGHDADGFCSAWIAHKFYGKSPNVEYIPVNHGQPPPDVKDKQVYIFDFSYKQNTILQMLREAISVTIIDHHPTAKEDLKDIKIANFGNFIGDGSQSAATLAWKFFYDNDPMPLIVQYIQDRDLWTWKLEYSREISAAISSYPFDFNTWNQFEENSYIPELISQGKAILRYQRQQVDRICKNAIEVEFDGHKVLQVNTCSLISEVGERLAQGFPFSMCWFIRKDGKKQYSLRSAQDGLDVSLIAKQHGGGGHKHAAGFELVCMI